MVGWHHRLNGCEFEQAPGVGDRQGSLEYCSPWGHKESYMIEQLNWTELNRGRKTGNFCYWYHLPIMMYWEHHIIFVVFMSKMSNINVTMRKNKKKCDWGAFIKELSIRIYKYHVTRYKEGLRNHHQKKRKKV